MFFFFSSRRRHTRFDCDWSSDVCSSDLEVARAAEERPRGRSPRIQPPWPRDRKSTRLNSSHSQISYAVFCLKKKKTTKGIDRTSRKAGCFCHSMMPDTVVAPHTQYSVQR